jgi:putative membrane protein
MKLVIRVLVTAVLVMVLSYFMKGVRVDGVATAIIVAVVLGLLNAFIKPVLVFFTLPLTIFTLGLFLIVINGILILVCTKIVGGFYVDSFWTAALFSIILSISQSIMYSITGGEKN